MKISIKSLHFFTKFTLISWTSQNCFEDDGSLLKCIKLEGSLSVLTSLKWDFLKIFLTFRIFFKFFFIFFLMNSNCPELNWIFFFNFLMVSTIDVHWAPSTFLKFSGNSLSDNLWSRSLLKFARNFLKCLWAFLKIRD